MTAIMLNQRPFGGSAIQSRTPSLEFKNQDHLFGLPLVGTNHMLSHYDGFNSVQQLELFCLIFVSINLD